MRHKFQKVTGIKVNKISAKQKARSYRKTKMLVKYRSKLNKLHADYKEEYPRANSKAALRLFYLKKMNHIR